MGRKLSLKIKLRCPQDPVRGQRVTPIIETQSGEEVPRSQWRRSPRQNEYGRCRPHRFEDRFSPHAGAESRSGTAWNYCDQLAESVRKTADCNLLSSLVYAARFLAGEV